MQLDLIELFSMKQSRFNLSFDIKTQASPQKAPLISPVTGMSDGGWHSFCLPSGFTHFKTFFSSFDINLAPNERFFYRKLCTKTFINTIPPSGLPSRNVAM